MPPQEVFIPVNRMLLTAQIVGIFAVQEERTLRAELTSYDAYMAKVKYRLIPYA
jgi:protein-S-isoprenylcysteine O-methyltransferase Ste14